MIPYGRFHFASPPRTGTTWFLQAAYMTELGAGNKASVHEPPGLKWNKASRVLSIVRHPYDWLASYYHAIGGGMIGVPEVDWFAKMYRECSTYHMFVERVLDRPGCISAMFDRYAATDVLRLEDFPDAGVEFLQSITPQWKRPKWESIRTLGVMNSCNKREGFIEKASDDWLRKNVWDTERDFCERYEYYN